MKEQFVTYEIALKLKELGFDEPCFGYYIHHIWKNGNKVLFRSNFKSPIIEHHNTLPNQECSAPLWQQAIDWLREKHEIFVSIHYWGKRNVTSNNSVLYPNLFNYTICQELTPKEKWIESWYNNYEEAREQAILKAIELCKKN